MTHGRQLSAAAVLSLLALASLLIYLYWRVAVNALTLLLVGRVAWMYLTHRLGIKRRPKSSWSSLGRTAAIMYAAWNSRWLKPSVKASIPASADGEPKPAQYTDPFGGGIIATSEDIPF